MEIYVGDKLTHDKLYPIIYVVLSCIEVKTFGVYFFYQKIQQLNQVF